MHHVAVQVANQTADMEDNMEDMMRHFVLFVVEQEEEGAGNSRNAGRVEDDEVETLQ